MNQDSKEIKTNEPKPAAQEPELTTDELDQVNGGVITCRKAGGKPEEF